MMWLLRSISGEEAREFFCFFVFGPIKPKRFTCYSVGLFPMRVNVSVFKVCILVLHVVPHANMNRVLISSEQSKVGYEVEKALF